MVTPLITKLRQLAHDLVNDPEGTPRWLFLVGGPGNGKSEAVEALIEELDTQLEAGGKLMELVASKFQPNPVTPRRITVEPHELTQAMTAFRGSVRRLIIIQDASAVDAPRDNAEELLIEDLADLLTSPPSLEPVFICCANRGLLARGMSAIRSDDKYQWLNTPHITELFNQLLVATGLGPKALRTDRPDCWPLDYDHRFAAWPLDLDTIIRSRDDSSPFEEMLSVATDIGRWESEGRCTDCTSKALCPFYVNAATLQQESARRNLVSLLRHGEFAVGQRWNFRDAFSLCAELMVGQRQDFAGEDSHPCEWVHRRVDQATLSVHPDEKARAIWQLTLRLYQHALFPRWPDPSKRLSAQLLKRNPLTRAAIRVHFGVSRSEGTHVRSYLSGPLSLKLDPENATPVPQDSVLRQAEDEFGQSIQQGIDSLGLQVSELERQWLGLLASAEQSWTDAVRESARVQAVVETLRSRAAILVKRSIGVTQGEYLNREYLDDYESLLDKPERLLALVQPLRAIMASGEGGMFHGSLLRVFGQPLPGESMDVIVRSHLGPVLAKPAPRSSDSKPGHDLPWIEVDRERIPLTFDLYLALRLSADGCESASFPPHTRAAIDKSRDAIAARLSRDREGMMGGTVVVKIGEVGRLGVTGLGHVEFQLED